MSDSTRYFQLTPDILVEYSYNYSSSFYNQTGDATDHILDLKNDSGVINNGYCATRTFLYGKNKDRFVQPINKSESKFIQCIQDNSPIWDNNTDFRYDSLTSENADNDILKDSFKLHFTSRNYFGDYDGLIITVNIYDKIKNKIGILSHYIKRTDDPEINHNPVLINQKLYTTYKEFEIPSINAIYNVSDDSKDTTSKLKSLLSPHYGIMDNTPVIMSVYGVKSTYTNNNIEYYNVEKVNAIFIPLEDKSNSIEVECIEAWDDDTDMIGGDYFKIYPKIDNGNVSFSDYIYKISDGRPENYIVFYELTLKENLPKIEKGETKTESIITHREQYIINAAQHSDEENEKYRSNEAELDSIMYYRPIVINSGRIVSFTIDVNLNIINTLDNTTIVKRTSLIYDNPKKYGKNLNRIYLGDIPSKINVYNKKPDIDRDGVKIINSGGNVKIENHQHSVIGFIECANVGVSIEQIPKEDIQ